MSVIAPNARSQGTWTAERVGGLTSEQRQILAYLSLEMLDDGTGNLVPTVRITGANLQVVNGLAATNGLPDRPR